MRDHTGKIKGFIRHSDEHNTRPDSSSVDILYIGFYDNQGISTSGGFVIKWEYLCGNITPRLKAYDDGWSALANMPELIELMSEFDDANVSVDEFTQRLEVLGFKNLSNNRETLHS